MRDLIDATNVYRQFSDWMKVADDLANPAAILPLADKALAILPQLRAAQRTARRLADRYPASDGARVLQEILARGDEKLLARRGCAEKLRRARARLARRVAVLARRRARGNQRDPWVSG
jgi:hypothetical protein